ncbi:aspartyl/asparaginyl beta-hydroxylase domain-containing protein [Ectothiorhodospiraceae bacterium WFHF3C12]|nr:aspartyl/asparaginyl beta-hydroxylase domain-containing protein [Ectothiorhodospiraceae bacterium WFHF3C12]
MTEATRESTLKRPENLTERLGAWFMERLEALIASHSRVGDQPVFDRAQFPWAADVERDWQIIRGELDTVLERTNELPNFHDVVSDVETITADDNWKTFFLYAFGIPSKRNCEMCPETARILRRIPGLKTAFFSILAPGKRIPVHRGPYNGVLRYHLGLKVPAAGEQCWIRIGDRVCKWAEGEGLIFDDSYNHEVHNDTDEYRVVLFVDFVRPTRQPVDLLNRFLLKVTTLIPAIRHGMKQHARWEERFHGKTR